MREANYRRKAPCLLVPLITVIISGPKASHQLRIILCRNDPLAIREIWRAETRTRCLARGNSTCWSAWYRRHTRAWGKLNIPQNFVTPFPPSLSPTHAALKCRVAWNDSFTPSTSVSRHFLSPPLARKQERRINSFIRTEMRTQLYPFGLL